MTTNLSNEQWTEMVKQILHEVGIVLGLREGFEYAEIMPAIEAWKAKLRGERVDELTAQPGPIDPHAVEGPLRAHQIADLKKRFFFHKPRDPLAISNHETVSDETFALAVKLLRICPQGRNLSLALTALEDVRMRANAAIAVDDPRP